MKCRFNKDFLRAHGINWLYTVINAEFKGQYLWQVVLKCIHKKGNAKNKQARYCRTVGNNQKILPATIAARIVINYVRIQVGVCLNT